MTGEPKTSESSTALDFPCVYACVDHACDQVYVAVEKAQWSDGLSFSPLYACDQQ